MFRDDEQRVRLDKWLWAARFYKTRGMATQAVMGGQVRVNGVRAKPGKVLQPGDELKVHRGVEEIVVCVQAVSSRRGPALQAQTLYEETDDSKQARVLLKEQFRQHALQTPGSLKRPNKKERRHIIRFTRQEPS